MLAYFRIASSPGAPLRPSKCKRSWTLTHPVGSRSPAPGYSDTLCHHYRLGACPLMVCATQANPVLSYDHIGVVPNLAALATRCRGSVAASKHRDDRSRSTDVSTTKFINAQRVHCSSESVGADGRMQAPKKNNNLVHVARNLRSDCALKTSSGLRGIAVSECTACSPIGGLMKIQYGVRMRLKGDQMSQRGRSGYRGRRGYRGTLMHSQRASGNFVDDAQRYPLSAPLHVCWVPQAVVRYNTCVIQSLRVHELVIWPEYNVRCPFLHVNNYSTRFGLIFGFYRNIFPYSQSLVLSQHTNFYIRHFDLHNYHRSDGAHSSLTQCFCRLPHIIHKSLNVRFLWLTSTCTNRATRHTARRSSTQS